MITIEIYTAGGETLSGTFTLPVSATVALLSTLDPETPVKVNRRMFIALTRTTLQCLTHGNIVEIFV